MSDVAQYTLGLFDSTALGWTVPIPTAAPAPTDTDDEPEPPAAPTPQKTGVNFALSGDRQLARGWPARARDNIAAIRLSRELEDAGRAPTSAEQQRLMRFIGFGATDLAQNAFPLPGETDFRPGWQDIGADLAEATSIAEYAALQRSTQYAHYTPEPVIRAIWRAARHLGFSAGRVLEPGMGSGLFFALMPESLRDSTRLTGVEYDPITARIAALLHPRARVRREDYTRSTLGGGFDLAIGNPPFADRIIKADPRTAKLGLRLHDYFIARSIDRLRPGGLAIFVTSTGTMDKAGTSAREHIASMADLVGAVRLPESSMRATAGTEVVIDVLVFQRRAEGQAPRGPAWMELREIELGEQPAASEPELEGLDSQQVLDHETVTTEAAPERRHLRRGVVLVNEYFLTHPEMVLGEHGQRRGIYGPGWSYTCRAHANAGPLEDQLDAAFAHLPPGIFIPNPDALLEDDAQEFASPVVVGRAADGATIKEGSYHLGQGGRLCQIIGGESVPVAIKKGKSGDGISLRAAKIICGLIPIRDAVLDVLRAQAAGRPWQQQQVRLRTCYSHFIRYYGPINRTVISTQTDDETGEEREQHRRPNLTHFADDPDCWLVASIEDYDLDTGIARPGPIFCERVISPPAPPMITGAADALAVTLNEFGFVDPERLGELLECEPAEALAQLGSAVFRDPMTEQWETADPYLSGPVRHKLVAADAAARLDSQYQRNVAALQEVQPRDIPPSDITARLGAPWLPIDVIQDFVREVMGGEAEIFHTVEVAVWGVKADCFVGTAQGTSEWGTARRHAGQLLHDALNSATPQIYDVEIVDGSERRVFNAEATEAAKEKLLRIKTAFTQWVWTDPDRADRLSRLYNDRFNNLVPRHFDGRHLSLPGASDIIRLYDHQKRVIWRIITAGSTYMAHAVGSGKTFSIAAAIMEQRRLGLVNKVILVVPGHCLAQAGREFLQLYPTARILVADETNFAKNKRSRFLARAATACWDAIIITHSAFKFIAVPTAFEQQMIEAQIASFEHLITCVDGDDRITRKRLEAMKEKLAEKLETLRQRRDDMLTIEELGIDQIIVDEAQEFRKLTFATNRTTLKGVDPDGSQRAWDLYVKRWEDDLFAPAGEDSRYTTDVEAFFGAQQEWLQNNLPEHGRLLTVDDVGHYQLPKKAERVYGKPGKHDLVGHYIDTRTGEVQTIAYRLPEPKKPGKAGNGAAGGEGDGNDETRPLARTRAEVTQKGVAMIGDLRTDALHQALADTPIEDDTLLGLLILAFGCANVSVDSGSDLRASDRQAICRSLTEGGVLTADLDLLRQAARRMLIAVLSCRDNRSQSGLFARIAGETIGASLRLPNMATEAFLSCLSRNALETAAVAESVNIAPRAKDTRARMVKRFADSVYVYPGALFRLTDEDLAKDEAASRSRYVPGTGWGGGGGGGDENPEGGLEEESEALPDVEDGAATAEEPFADAAD